MNHTTNPQDAEPFRIPIAHSVRYAVRGLPEVPNQYGPGTLAPSEITLTYRSAPDSQLGRVHAYVAGRLWADGTEIPLLPGGLYGQHYDDGLEGWPDWLAEEARLHGPDAPSAVVSADRATLLREVADIAESLRQFEPASGARWSAQVSENVGILRVVDHLRQLAAEADGSRVAAEEQPAETQDEDPARIDRLRPEFTQHASIEAIDHQTRRAQRQSGLWDARIRKLTVLRQTRQAQMDAGTWPTPATEQPDAQTREADRG